MESAADNQTYWHTLSPADALARLKSRPEGLSSDEAARRLREHGPNHLPPPPRRSSWMRFLLQFHNVLIYVLLGAAVVTAFLGHAVDTLVIVGVVVINALIGFIQEGKAESALDAIRNLLSLHAVVLRDGHRQEIGAEDLVPGDVVFLQSGDKVPADLRLIEVRTLKVDESMLTGESESVEKSLEPAAPDTSLGDRLCMAHSGTLVTYGQGLGLVVSTGAQTEIGRISRLLAEVEEITTPLLRKMAHFARWLTVLILVFSAITFAVGFWVWEQSGGEVFMAAVGLAVAAIPEGLPAIMTITLAIGVQRMARRKTIIRRLPAVETLGSVTVICSDKTGTLTRNEMTVQRVVTADQVFHVDGTGYAPRGGFTIGGKEALASSYPELADIGRAALLCNDAIVRESGGHWIVEGDPTEGALVTLAMKAGLDPVYENEAQPRRDVIPFESEHRFMATLHHDHAGHGFIFLKGAPERVMEMCAFERSGGEDRTMRKAYWHDRMEETARLGQRLLAVACRPVAGGTGELRFGDMEDGFTLLALFGIMDPPRDEAVEAIRLCHRAGIDVKMITGDHAATAQAIGGQLGIDASQVLTGSDIEKLDASALRKAVREADIFARANPEHKLRLVEAMQSNGDICAMTGDGVNDSPALKRADVGVSMGIKGTEAAKDASEMVLVDDNFASIVSAVEEGRTVYENIRKAIVYILAVSGGQAGMVMAATLTGHVLPITPVQILWVNMVTAVTLSLALAFEHLEPGIMERPPRDPGEALITPFLVARIIVVATLLIAGSYGLFLWYETQGLSLEQSRAIAVNTLVMGEVFFLFSSRYLRASALSIEGLFGNVYVMLSIAAIIVIQALFTYAPPMHLLFGVAAFPPHIWLWMLAFGIFLFFSVELEKAVIRRLGARIRT
ncbi:MAG: cation-transporting P-type ATPase [Deltaproteobacteria bacterium]|nr:cation-transporting P-type ATPase [Deltaproteobacteria bacterium]